MKINKKIDYIPGLLCVFISLITASVKLSYMVGSSHTFFSAANIMIPFTGLIGGISAATLLCLLRVVRFLFLRTWSWSLLAHVVPGFGASLYWSLPPLFMGCIVPFVCMILFIMHPIGFQAMVYTSFWLIPIGVYFYSTKNLFLHALSSTLVAHALGSVIWLYTVPMTAALWIGLMPIVVIERIVFALGIVVMHACAVRTMEWYSNRFKKTVAALLSLVQNN